MILRRLLRGTALLGLVAVSAQSLASVQIMGTRFVYPANEREIVVSLSNDSGSPALLQSWLDSGNPKAKPGSENLPFAVIPPLIRVEAHKGQALRIMQISNQLPTDHESVFWLNVLDIPPKSAKVAGQNSMQLAFRSRVKLFYRPDGLKGKPQDAAKTLTWSLARAGAGYVLRAHNSSAYHVSFSEVSLTGGAQTYSCKEGGMVAPGGSADFPLKGLNAPVGSGKVQAIWIDDYGATRQQHYTF